MPASVRQSPLLVLLVLLLVGRSAADGDSRAVLVGTKSVLNNLVVKGKDITVQYDIYNIGEKAAVNVQLEEDTFPVDYFAARVGFQHARWGRIQPGGNVSHSLILTPLQSFVFNVSHATMRYKTEDEAQGVVVGYTTGAGEISVYDVADYERQFSAHATEWLTFGMMTTPSILIPFLLWYMSMQKYTGIGRSGRKTN